MSTFQFVLNQTLLGMQIRNILYYDLTGPDPTQMQPYVDLIRAAYVDIKDALVNDWAINGVTVHTMDGLEAPGVDYSFSGGSLAGQALGDPLPPFVCALVTAKALVPLYPQSAKTFVGGWPEGQSDVDGRPATAVLTLINQLANNFETLSPAAMPTADRVAAKIVNGNAVATNPVTSTIVSGRWHPQRRRNYES